MNPNYEKENKNLSKMQVSIKNINWRKMAGQHGLCLRRVGDGAAGTGEVGDYVESTARKSLIINIFRATFNVIKISLTSINCTSYSTSNSLNQNELHLCHENHLALKLIHTLLQPIYY